MLATIVGVEASDVSFRRDVARVRFVVSGTKPCSRRGCDRSIGSGGEKRDPGRAERRKRKARAKVCEPTSGVGGGQARADEEAEYAFTVSTLH